MARMGLSHQACQQTFSEWHDPPDHVLLGFLLPQTATPLTA
jgi:hypothetical protein